MMMSFPECDGDDRYGLIEDLLERSRDGEQAGGMMTSWTSLCHGQRESGK
jgi:hypothetical protein